jgi:tRNA(Arg) A34 adenosine deaminase TadA
MPDEGRWRRITAVSASHTGVPLQLHQMPFPQLVLSLPQWVEHFLSDRNRAYTTVEERMGLAIELSRLNIERGTGGPFGAAIFDQERNQLLAVGVNLVVSSQCSIAHAEILAIVMAQQITQQYDLGRDQKLSCELVTSTEPCAMCFGAIPWSGIRRVVCGARQEDARGIGFDEGPRPHDWVQALQSRGITVLRDILREEAADVLQQYQMNGGTIY